MRRKNHILSGILISVLTTLLLLAIMEVALRISGQKAVEQSVLYHHSDIPGLLYEHRPDTTIIQSGILISTNPYGMRAGNYTLPKPRNVRRIAVLGDSVTSSLDLNLSDTFPHILEQKLNEKQTSKQTEVLNFGVNGYGTREEAIILKSKAMAFQPDVIVVAYVLNDPEISTSFISYFTQRPKEGKRICKIHIIRLPIPCAARDLIDSMRLPTFLYGKGVKVWNNLNGDYYTRVSQSEQSWQNVAQGFTSIRETAKKDNIPVVVVIFPLLYGNAEHYKWGWVHEKVREEAEKNGFPVIDLLDSYSPYNWKDLQIVKSDIVHPNRKGQEIAAQEIYTLLKEKGLAS